MGGLAQDCLIFSPLGRFACVSAWPAKAAAVCVLRTLRQLCDCIPMIALHLVDQMPMSLATLLNSSMLHAEVEVLHATS